MVSRGPWGQRGSRERPAGAWHVRDPDQRRRDPQPGRCSRL